MEVQREYILCLNKRVMSHSVCLDSLCVSQLLRGWLTLHTSATWWPKLVWEFSQRRAPSWFWLAPTTGEIWREDTHTSYRALFIPQLNLYVTCHTYNISWILHFSLPFYHFATNEAIQRTEAYEYAQSLGSHPCSLPNFQVDLFDNYTLTNKPASTPLIS